MLDFFFFFAGLRLSFHVPKQFFECTKYNAVQCPVPTWKSSLSITVSELLCRVSLVRLDMSLNNPAGKLSR